MQRHISQRTVLTYLLLGAFAGLAYSALDEFLDAGMLSGALQAEAWKYLHAFIDGIIPMLVAVAVSLGMYSAHQSRVLAEMESRRAADARARLEKIERDQGVWLMAASILHQAANPLHSVGLLFDELATLGEASPVERKAMLARCREKLNEVTQALAQLRALPSLRRPELTRMSLNQALAQLIPELAEQHGVAVSLAASPEPLHVVANATYLRVILDNLIDNAAEATRSVVNPRLRVEILADGARSARVLISDNGPGLEDSERAHVFELLRVGSGARHLGMGLPIARALAESMRGELSCLAGGPGATFELRLPVADIEK